VDGGSPADVVSMVTQPCTLDVDRVENSLASLCQGLPLVMYSGVDPGVRAYSSICVSCPVILATSVESLFPVKSLYYARFNDSCQRKSASSAPPPHNRPPRPRIPGLC
jgi:hypothetical protein